jgi:hypothetical protein
MIRFGEPLDFEHHAVNRAPKTTWDIIRDNAELSSLAMNYMRFDIEPEFIKKKPGFPKVSAIDSRNNGISGSPVDVYELKPEITLPAPVDALVFTFPSGKKLTVSKSFIMHHSQTIRDIVDRGMLEDGISMTLVPRSAFKLALHILYNPGALNDISMYIFRVDVMGNLLLAAEVLNMPHLKSLLNMALPNYLNFYFQVVKFYGSLVCAGGNNRGMRELYMLTDQRADTAEDIANAKELLNSDPSGYALINVHHLIVILDRFSYFGVLAKVFKLGRDDIAKVIASGVNIPGVSDIVTKLKPETYIAMIRVQQDHIHEINETAGFGNIIKNMKQQIGY